MPLVGLEWELACSSGFVSQSDATLEKVNKSLACCVKQTQELTILDIWWGIMLNWIKTWTEYPLELPCTHVLAQMLFFIQWEENVIITEQVVYLAWERAENSVGAAWHLLLALYEEIVWEV